jgi:ubiquinone/menaquinone biosynthesis C-methylase UbiE
MILDVGCGKHKRGTIGVDYSRNSDADIIADAPFLPFKDEVFDEVASFKVLEHSPNPLNFLKEQTRVLKPGGKIVCITDNAQFYRWSVMGGRFGQIHELVCTDQYCIFYPENVMKMMERIGLSDIKSSLLPKEKQRFLDLVVKFLVMARILRSACLYPRFQVSGVNCDAARAN